MSYGKVGFSKALFCFTQRVVMCWRRCSKDESGQSTVEYAVVLLASLSTVLALGLLWKLGAQGKLQELAAQAASHLLQSLGGFRDIVLY